MTTTWVCEERSDEAISSPLAESSIEVPAQGNEIVSAFRASQTLVITDCGLLDYSESHRQQLAIIDKKKRGEVLEDYLMLVEHPDVYTYGRKSKDPLLPPDVPAFGVERGGESTFHNPGQLVAYPLLFLSSPERDLHRHLRRLESTLIDVLTDFGLQGERRAGATGVWMVGKEKKIASIGVAVSGWVTYHGSALNVDNDLRGFTRISPCGFAGEVMTSMKAELGANSPTLELVKASFIQHFCRHFERVLAS